MSTREHTLLVARGVFELAGERERLRGRAVLREGDLDVAALPDLTDGVDGIVVTVQPLRAGHIAAFAPGVRVIGRAGVGLDTIDGAAAARRGIAITYQPSYATAEVATHAVALLLGLQRRIVEGDAIARQRWSQRRAHYVGVADLSHATVGVIGCGAIGRAVIDRLRPLVGHVIGYDLVPDAVPASVERGRSLDDLFERVDAVSLHAPLTADTAGLLGAAALARLRPGALVVNVARGDLVDEAAVAAALVDGRLGGYAADTFAVEPLADASPLRGAPRTLFSPHMAWYSDASAIRLREWTFDSVLDHLDGVAPRFGRVVPAGERGEDAG